MGWGQLFQWLPYFQINRKVSHILKLFLTECPIKEYFWKNFCHAQSLHFLWVNEHRKFEIFWWTYKIHNYMSNLRLEKMGKIIQFFIQPIAVWHFRMPTAFLCNSYVKSKRSGKFKVITVFILVSWINFSNYIWYHHSSQFFFNKISNGKSVLLKWEKF